jgi:hypothetical protein
MKDKICSVIDVAVPSEWIVIQKESKNKLKYKYLSVEIQWNMKCFVIPAIIEATGIVNRGLKKIWKRYQESIQKILYKKQLY